MVTRPKAKQWAVGIAPILRLAEPAWKEIDFADRDLTTRFS
jgi:hypothetical protein